ncbi:MAG: hypothetical protein ACXU8N_00540 [Telluria sp.]
MKFAFSFKRPFARRALPVRAHNPHFAQRDHARQRRLSLLMFLPFGFACLLIGAVAGLDAPVLLSIVAGALFALFGTFILPSYIFLQVLFVVNFIVQGSAQYFAGVRVGTWVAAGMAGLFMLRVLMDFVFARRNLQEHGYAPRAAGGVLVAVLAYLSVYGITIVLNRPGAGQLISAFKSNLPGFGVLASFMWFYWKPAHMERLWKIGLWVMVLNLPVVVYQHFFVATKRHNGFDSVVGTFGGTPLAGGLSSMLVLFTIAMMCYALARWNRGLLSTRNMLALCVVGMAIIVLGEVKAAFFWLPLSMFIVLRQRILRNLFTAIAYGSLALVLVGGIYYSYKVLYWDGSVDHVRTRAEQERVDNYFFDPNNVDYTTGEVSRGASLAFWWNDRLSPIPQRLVGYGPGAVKSAGPLGGGGVIAKRYAPLAVDATALAMLLWDEGVIGALCYTSILLTALWTGWKWLRRGVGSARQMAMVETSVGTLAVFVTMLIYNRTQLDEPVVQLMLMFCLGCVVQMARFQAPDEAASAPAPAQRAGARRPARALRGAPVYVGG